MLDDLLLLSVWSSNSTVKVSEGCLNLMCWRPAGCDDTADDLGNVTCKNTISPARSPLREYVCVWEKLEIVARNSMHACAFTSVFVYACVCTSWYDLLTVFCPSIRPAGLEEAGRCTAVFLFALPTPLHPHPHPSSHISQHSRSSWAEFTRGKMSVQLPC